MRVLRLFLLFKFLPIEIVQENFSIIMMLKRPAHRKSPKSLDPVILPTSHQGSIGSPFGAEAVGSPFAGDGAGAGTGTGVGGNIY